MRADAAAVRVSRDIVGDFAIASRRTRSRASTENVIARDLSVQKCGMRIGLAVPVGTRKSHVAGTFEDPRGLETARQRPT